MKISIWQQFSSNHSASFEVIGKFETIEEAQAAETTLKDIIQRIGDDYRDNFTKDTLSEINPYMLSELEDAIKDEYNISNWSHSLEWTFSDLPNDTVRRFENLVIVCNKRETWSGYKPFDQLMQKLGGETAYGVETSNQAYVTVHCTTPDEEFAANVVRKANKTKLQSSEDVYEFTVPGTNWRIWGNIFHDGNRLTVHEISVGIGDYAAYKNDTVSILQTLCDYLKAQGCTDFEYDVYSL